MSLLGLVDRPGWRDPLLGLLVTSQVLAQALLDVPGDTVERVGDVVRRYNQAPLLDQLWQRLLLGLIAAGVVWLLPALARRSHRRWRGSPTRVGALAGLWDAPWHRDPALWASGVLTSLPLWRWARCRGTAKDPAGRACPTGQQTW